MQLSDFENLAKTFELRHVARALFDLAQECVHLSKIPSNDEVLPIGISKKRLEISMPATAAATAHSNSAANIQFY